MKNFFLIFIVVSLLITIIIFGCSKTNNPTQPTQTPVPSFTPTSTMTLTGNVIILDNFSDGNLINNYSNEWSPYWPFDGQWASTPVVTQGYSDYALKVTGHVTANNGFMPSNGYFGTTTYIDNLSGIDIRPINYINIILKTIENVPVANVGFFDKIIIMLCTPDNSSFAEYSIIPTPNTTWQVYKINIDNFNFFKGSPDDLFSKMGFIGIYISYTSTIQNEEAQAELYVDEVYFSEN